MQFQCSFTSAETRYTCSFSVALRPQRPYGRAVSVSLYVHRDQTQVQFQCRFKSTETRHTCSFSEALRPQRLYGLLRTGIQNVHLDFHTAPELCPDAHKGPRFYSLACISPALVDGFMNSPRSITVCAIESNRFVQ